METNTLGRPERIQAGLMTLRAFGQAQLQSGVRPSYDVLAAKERVRYRKNDLKVYLKHVSPDMNEGEKAQVIEWLKDDIREAGRVFAASFSASHNRIERTTRLHAGRAVLRAFLETPAGQDIRAQFSAFRKPKSPNEYDLNGFKAFRRSQAQARRAA